jgi:twinkle protein
MLIRPRDKAAELGRLRTGGAERKGLSMGFDCFDGPSDIAGNIKIAKSYLSIFTGYPSSGKSEFVDAIMMNMALVHGWKTLYFSPENHPIEEHLSKLAEKYMGKPIYKFQKDEAKISIEFLHQFFTWMDPEDPSLDKLLELAMIQLKDGGIDALVIDPWNSVTHHRGGELVHEYLQVALTKLIRFSRRYNVHVAIVAHPKIPQKDKDGAYPTPDLYSISDGAMWRNKADYGCVVHRPDITKNRVEIHWQKRKYKWMGTPGIRTMDYEVPTGRFKATDEKEFLLPTDVEAPF